MPTIAPDSVRPNKLQAAVAEEFYFLWATIFRDILAVVRNYAIHFRKTRRNNIYLGRKLRTIVFKLAAFEKENAIFQIDRSVLFQGLSKQEKKLFLEIDTISMLAEEVTELSHSYEFRESYRRLRTLARSYKP